MGKILNTQTLIEKCANQNKAPVFLKLFIKMSQILPPYLKSEVSGYFLKNGKILIRTSNASARTELKNNSQFYLPTLQTLEADFCKTQGIKAIDVWFLGQKKFYEFKPTEALQKIPIKEKSSGDFVNPFSNPVLKKLCGEIKAQIKNNQY